MTEMPCLARGAELPKLDCARIGVIGMGYVGLPLAAAFGRDFTTVGFDIKRQRIDQLVSGQDSTGELTEEALKSARKLRFSCDERDLADCNVLIVAVPTPITKSRTPDLAPLIAASEVVGRCIRRGGVVIYESTVYPGATEEDCIPVVERISGLRYNVDFFAGYSPERINPGDRERPLSRIVKVTSGSTPEAAEFVDALYRRIITAGTHRAASIRVAEAAKIVENTQRDVNIALINELSIIFANLGIDTNEVLDAAATKWNFVRLHPGLVGGHCIGVDPYHLVHKSIDAGHVPDIIRTAREINDGMARHAAVRLVSAMVARNLPVKGARVLVAGFTFKANCPDTRNTKVADLVSHLQEWGMQVELVDPRADPDALKEEYGLDLATALPSAAQGYHAVVLAVAHEELVAPGPQRLRSLLKPGGVLFDLPAAFPKSESELRL
nr:nucleotide sugar dehydrogenase [Tabrizicola sp. YIM 78059]